MNGFLLQETLTAHLLFGMLSKRPKAMDVYENYLRRRRDHNQLKFLYLELGRTKDAAMQMLSQAYGCSNVRAR